jgi:uncharacterized protein
MNADDVIHRLGLIPLPEEGGLFRETYRTLFAIPPEVLPTGYGSPRAAATAIYYLVTPTSFSGLHRVRGNEIFHYYMGDPVEMLQLRPDGTGGVVVIGTDLAAGMMPQVIVPGGVWQGLRLKPDAPDRCGFALLGTTMTPGFDYADFEVGRREVLMAAYPEFAERIRELARG